jgi:hypothetical protein
MAICVIQKAIYIMPRGSSVSIEVDQEVRRLASFTIYGKAQIYRALQDHGFIDAGGHPSKSTVERLVDKYRSVDVSGPWSLLDADPEEARNVRLVAWWLDGFSGGYLWLSKDLASWIARIVAVVPVPTIPMHWAWALARCYQAARAREEHDVRCLDLALIHQVWDDKYDPVDDPELAKKARVARGCQLQSGEVGLRQWNELTTLVDDVSMWVALPDQEEAVPRYVVDDESYGRVVGGSIDGSAGPAVPRPGNGGPALPSKTTPTRSRSKK